MRWKGKNDDHTCEIRLNTYQMVASIIAWFVYKYLWHTQTLATRKSGIERTKERGEWMSEIKVWKKYGKNVSAAGNSGLKWLITTEMFVEIYMYIQRSAITSSDDTHFSAHSPSDDGCLQINLDTNISLINEYNANTFDDSSSSVHNWLFRWNFPNDIKSAWQ